MLPTDLLIQFTFTEYSFCFITKKNRFQQLLSFKMF